MAELNQVVIVSAARTAIGSFDGDLKDIPAPQPASIVIKAVVERAKIDPAIINEVIVIT